MNMQKPFLENPSDLIIPAAVPLLDRPVSPLRCPFCSFFNKLVFAMSKTSNSSLFPYQEPRPTKEDALRPFPNLVMIPISDRPQLEGERVICKNFICNNIISRLRILVFWMPPINTNNFFGGCYLFLVLGCYLFLVFEEQTYFTDMKIQG